MNRALPGVPRITVRNLQRSVPIDAAKLQEFAERALIVFFDSSSEGRTRLRRLTEISILLISDRRMSKLHRRFLNTAGSTDVITFHHGEILISAETARKHARRFKSSILREIQLYIVHGLLHLSGYEDRTKTGARKMEIAQEKIRAAASKADKDD
jgi:probable rRNA maturation factor